MEIVDYDKIKLHFEEINLIFPRNVIEKFQVDKVEQLIEKKYITEEIYDVYIVINRKLAEEIWEEEISSQYNGIYETLVECINSNYIYDIIIYKDEKIIGTFSPVWSYTEFENENQRIGITNDKIIIRIKEL